MKKKQTPSFGTAETSTVRFRYVHITGATDASLQLRGPRSSTGKRQSSQ